MVDAHIFLKAQISPYFIHPKDFASDILVYKLTLYSTNNKLDDTIYDGHTIGKTEDAEGLGCTIFFMRLHLHARNRKNSPQNHRALYIWKSIIWFVSLYGLFITPMKNLMSETIANGFLVMQYDVYKWRYCTTESAEHSFGNVRRFCREFSASDF